MVSQPSQIFVGRQRELTVLNAALENSMAGQGKLVMLAGEPGIGKTRTATELAAKAQEQGAQVYWGWCYEGEGAPPYWPWIQSIRSYVRNATAGQLEANMGSNAAAIATLLPEVHEKLPGLGAPPELEPEQARFRLFDSIAALFKNASATTPLVIVLEDLHWGDRSSLMLCEFISREIAASKVMLLGTYRDVEVDRSHPLSQTLGALIRELNFERVQLGGLEPSEVGRFVELNAGVTLTQPNLEMVHTRTEGNPLFLNELVRLLDEEDTAASGDWTTSLPEGVRDVIGRRLHRLSEKTNEILMVAAVIGREFPLGQLTPLIDDLDEQQVLQVLDDALSARIIEEFSRILGRYRFSHSLIQETLVEELTTSRRVRLHAQIAEALNQLYASDEDAHAAELAHHYFEAGTAGSAEKLAHYSALAGEQAIASYAWEDALIHFQRGLTAKGVALAGPEAATDVETATLLFGQGRALLSTTQSHFFNEAVASLRRAFEYFVNAGQVEKAISVAEYPYSSLNAFDTGMAELIAKALSMVSPESRAAGRLLSRYGQVLALEIGDFTGAKRAVESALVIAQREEDSALEMLILAEGARADRYGLNFDEVLSKSQRALEIALEFDDLRVQVIAEGEITLSLFCKGELQGAMEHGASLVSGSDRLLSGNHHAYSSHYNMILYHSMGDWQTARTYGAKGLAVSPEYLGLLDRFAAMEHELGNKEQGDKFLEQLLALMDNARHGANTFNSFPAMIVPYIARITGESGRIGTAKRAAEIILAVPSISPMADRSARIGLALMAVVQQDANAAEGLYGSFAPGLPGMPVQGTICHQRMLGLLSQTMGKLDQAVVHFEESLQFCRAGYQVELAWTCSDYAETLFQRGARGDRQKADSLLDEALSISSALSMQPLMERVITLKGSGVTQPESPLVHNDSLTEREVDVLRLIASGKTNQEIGDELFISARTVANHAANIFNKTGAANRAEAATYASRNGLV